MSSDYDQYDKLGNVTPMRTASKHQGVLTFNAYQERAARTAIYPGQRTVTGLTYVSLGLVGESGEIANKVKKIIRDDEGVLTLERRQDLLSECSDVMWYLAQLITELDATMSDVAEHNLRKLSSRQERGTLGGSGDKR